MFAFIIHFKQIIKIFTKKTDACACLFDRIVIKCRHKNKKSFKFYEKKISVLKRGFFSMPVLIIATYDENQNPDAMHADLGGITDDAKTGICLTKIRKTTQNILLNKAFIVSIADARHVPKADYVGIVFQNDDPVNLEYIELGRVAKSLYGRQKN